MGVLERRDVGREVDADVNDLASVDAEIMTLKFGARNPWGC
jgi:hypothetical protein